MKLENGLKNENIRSSKKLEKYFNADITGSYMFVEKGLLSINDIKNIDVMVDDYLLENVVNYLQDMGYKYYYHSSVRVSLLKDGDLTIVIIAKNPYNKLYTMPELIAKKFKLNTHKNYETLEKVMRNAKLNYEKKWNIIK